MRWKSFFKPSEWRSRPDPDRAAAPATVPDPTPQDPTVPDEVFERAWAELELKQQFNIGAWGLGKTERWDVDFDAGTLIFSNADGFTVTTAVQVIGTYDTTDGTWLWGWDHPSVDAPLAEAANLAHDFGETYGLERCTTRMLECTEDEAWRFTALALYLSKGAGSYRGPTGPTGSTYLYMTFSDVKIQQKH